MIMRIVCTSAKRWIIFSIKAKKQCYKAGLYLLKNDKCDVIEGG